MKGGPAGVGGVWVNIGSAARSTSMIAGLFKNILVGDVFEKEKNEGWGFPCAMERDNVGMHRNGLGSGRKWECE
jgi:hypothetical protein